MVIVPRHRWHRLSWLERLAADVARRWQGVRGRVAAWRRDPAGEFRRWWDRGHAALVLLIKGRTRRH